jgi:hypothetical protein
MESIYDIPRFQTHPIPYGWCCTCIYVYIHPIPPKMIGFIPYKMVQNWEGYPQSSLQQNQELLVGTRCPPHSEGFLPPGSPCAPPTSTPQSAHPSDVSPKKKGTGLPIYHRIQKCVSSSMGNNYSSLYVSVARFKRPFGDQIGSIHFVMHGSCM